MSVDIDIGGPAFPFVFVNDSDEPTTDNFGDPVKPNSRLTFCGMSLRDYFAAKALQGWLSTYSEDLEAEQAEPGAAIVARLAYAMADAMLKARQS